jgi:hypothetical protein
MDEKTALHTAARRYCQDRFSYWSRIYEELQAQGQEKFEPGWDYSEEEYRTFPRYRIAKAIQVEVERLTVDHDTSLSELRTRLIKACDLAEAHLNTELKNPIARKSLHEETEDYKVCR